MGINGLYLVDLLMRLISQSIDVSSAEEDSPTSKPDAFELAFTAGLAFITLQGMSKAAVDDNYGSGLRAIDDFGTFILDIWKIVEIAGDCDAVEIAEKLGVAIDMTGLIQSLMIEITGKSVNKIDWTAATGLLMGLRTIGELGIGLENLNNG